MQGTSPGAGHIFISHSTRDMDSSLRVCAHLETSGLRCWMAPRDIRPGSDWAEAIMMGIADARAMILLLTSSSNQSAQVRREVEHAVNAGVPIIPVVLEGAEPSMALRYYISAHQWMEAPEGLTDAFLGTLAGSLREPASRTAEAPVPPEAASAPRQPAAPVPAGSPGASNQQGAGSRRRASRLPRIVLIVAVMVVIVFALLFIRKVSEVRRGLGLANRQAESGDWPAALRTLEEMEGNRAADSLRQRLLLQGISESHRMALDAPRQEGEAARRRWAALLALLQEYASDYGLDGEQELELTWTLGEALSALGAHSDAGDVYMEIVWNDDLEHAREQACVMACRSYQRAFDQEEGIDSAEVRALQLEALEILAEEHPESEHILPLAMDAARQCLATGFPDDALRLAIPLYESSPEPVIRSEAALIASLALEALGDGERAAEWLLRAQLEQEQDPGQT
ncbi:toll/interleukin-1 receptor domain-containing protein, partial [Candidatus Fermentibacterales bacterium]|nr:toll/interleukin-1 receptor domain-containing protein [Candidatus Fermentibacterales bacterium]